LFQFGSKPNQTVLGRSGMLPVYHKFSLKIFQTQHYY